MKDYIIDQEKGFRLTRKALQKSEMFAAAGIRLASISSEPSYQAALTVALYKQATNLMTLQNSTLEARLCKQAMSELVYGNDLDKAAYLLDKITKLQTWQLVIGGSAANR